MAAKKSQKSKQQQALIRLVNKLSALRTTLRGEERALLDAIVTNAQFEVAGHSAAMAKDAGAVTAATTRGSRAAADRAATLKASTRGQPRQDMAEVIGHAAVTKGVPAVTTAADMGAHAGAIMRVDVDDKVKAYKVNIL